MQRTEKIPKSNVNDTLKKTDAEKREVAALQAKLRSRITPLSASQACQILDLDQRDPIRTMQAIANSGKVLGYDVNGETIYPSFQFDRENRCIYPVMERFIQLLDHKHGPYYLLYFLVTKNKIFAGAAPKDCIVSQSDRVFTEYRNEIIRLEQI
jgi:hypothetical protein